MVASRSRRSRIRRGTVTVLVVTVAATVSMTMAPVLASHRALGAPALTGQVRLGALAHEPESIHTPAPVERIPSYAPIGVRPWAPDGPTATVATRMALKKRLERLRAKYAIPGVSVAILFPDGGMWVGASGSADIAGKVPVTPATAFAIASISKTFTSALILALRDEDRLDLDASARTYLPDLRIDPKITVRQLLDHTSGLRDYFFHPLIDPVLREHPTRDWNEAEAMRYVGKPYFKPGRGWHYSNTNYLILGLLAEAVGGAPLAEQLRTRFAEPLGLSATYYQPDETPSGPVAHGYRFASTSTEAEAVDLSDGTSVVPFTSVVTAAAGAGGMASSASDLARWARALYAGNVLSPETAQEMLDDVARTRPFKPTVPYGLGVQVVTIDGDVTLGHSGRLLGFRSAMRWLPEEGVAIAVLTNQSRTDPGIIVKALLKIALKPTADAPAWPGRHRPEPEFAR